MDVFEGKISDIPNSALNYSLASNQEDFKKRFLLKISYLYNFYSKNRDQKSLTASWYYTSARIGRSSRRKLVANVVKTELIFSIDQRINHFFRCVYCFVISLKRFLLWTPHQVIFLPRLGKVCCLLSYFASFLFSPLSLFFMVLFGIDSSWLAV